MPFEVDLSVKVAGVSMKNPLVLSEGPLTANARLIKRAAEHPIGAITTKSIQQQNSRSENPYMIAVGRGLINADWTATDLDGWLPELDQIDIPMPLFTNIGTNKCPPKKAAEFAAVLQEHGASFVTFSDYEPENLVDAIRFARKQVKVPLMVKLPPFVKNIGDLCKRLEDAGVDMIAAMDAVGPAMDIDVKTRRPILGCDGSFGYLSSAPIFPLTLAYIAEIAQNVSVPILGVGGVTCAEDVIKLIMVGATCVGMVGTPILKGLSIFDKVEADLKKWMVDNQVRSLDEIRGCAKEYMHHVAPQTLRAQVDADACLGCGMCVTSCYAGAITQNGEKKAVVNYDYCTGCGVCQTVCRARAICVSKDMAKSEGK